MYTYHIISFFYYFTLPNCHFQNVTFQVVIKSVITKLLVPNCHFHNVTKLSLRNCLFKLSLPNCHFCELTKLSVVTLPSWHYQIVITKLTLRKIRPSSNVRFTSVIWNLNLIKNVELGKVFISVNFSIVSYENKNMHIHCSHSYFNRKSF